MSSRADRDPYLVLGVRRQASPEEIARAYKRAARATHPDGGGSGAGSDRFRAVSDAYELLRDPARRAGYDRLHPVSRQPARAARWAGVERRAVRPTAFREDSESPTGGIGMANLLIRDPFLAAPFRLMDEILRSSGNGTRATGFTPPVDVHETENEYLVKLDLPGVKPDDVNIEVNDSVLAISGSRLADESGTAQLVERPYGTFARSLTLPQGVDSESIEAGYQDGVLELRIPKPAEQKPKKIAIGGAGKKAIEK